MKVYKAEDFPTREQLEKSHENAVKEDIALVSRLFERLNDADDDCTDWADINALIVKAAHLLGQQRQKTISRELELWIEPEEAAEQSNKAEREEEAHAQRRPQ